METITIIAVLSIAAIGIALIISEGKRSRAVQLAEYWRDKVETIEIQSANTIKAQYNLLCARDQQIEILENKCANYLRTLKLVSTIKKQQKRFQPKSLPRKKQT